jgi:hypothetical protein
MAQKRIVVLTDDIDGIVLGRGEGETISFVLDGQQYEIDLSKSNAKKLREMLHLYIDHARKVEPHTSSTRRIRDGAVTRDVLQTQAIREWARRNGHKVSDRGRIPRSVVEAFKTAQ